MPWGSVLRWIYEEVIGYAGTLRRFRAESAKAFDYLVAEFGFQPPVFEATSYGTLCRFENATTVFEVHLDWSEELILPYVRPGEASAARRAIEPPGVLLDAIMVRRGERPEKQSGVLTTEGMHRTISEYARALRVCAPEALRGEFTELISIRTARPDANWRLRGGRI